ncbi:MAG: glycosyltransferase [Kouleothrix sp.]
MSWLTATTAAAKLVATLAAADSRLRVIGSAERGGRSRGIRQGVALARGQLIGFVDADYKTPIEELAKLMPWLERGYDIVIGSRGMAESRIIVPQPLYRRLGSRAFAVAMHLLIGLWRLHDTQCGFKFFRADVARNLFGASASTAICSMSRCYTWLSRAATRSKRLASAGKTTAIAA